MNTQRPQNRTLRVLDVVLVLITAPLWLPVIGTIGALVLVTSGRPMMYRQERVGRHGRRFIMCKFRSMTNGDNPLVPDPDKITPIGRLLRRTSLDELPQLLNVLGGSMSLVGPRPMLPSQETSLTADQATRHLVAPGLTGLAQINGRNSLTWDERFTYDVSWATNPTVRRYLLILAKTARTVLNGSGVAGHQTTDRVVQHANAARNPSQASHP